MTTQEFDILMQIVYSRWGAKSYPDSVKSRIYYHCRKLPQKSFETIIYILLDSVRTAPMPNEFKALAYSEMDRLGLKQLKEPETKPSVIAKCWDCGDSGNLFVLGHDGIKHGVLRCHCPVGSARPQSQGGQWTEAYESSWVKEPCYVKGQGNWKPTAEQSLNDMVKFLRKAPPENSKIKRIGKLENPFKPREP